LAGNINFRAGKVIDVGKDSVARNIRQDTGTLSNPINIKTINRTRRRDVLGASEKSELLIRLTGPGQISSIFNGESSVALRERKSQANSQ
jgi:hypothetical protein